MTLFIISVLILGLGVYEAFFAGEKYMNWWFSQLGKNYQDYDQRRFRIIRGVSLTVAAVLVSAVELNNFKNVAVFLAAVIAVVVLQYVLVLRCCKLDRSRK